MICVQKATVDGTPKRSYNTLTLKRSTMSNIKTANVAKAKIVYYKDKETYKIIFAFNVHKKEKDNGDIVYMFPTQAKCAYVSGDISYEELQKDKLRIIAQAKQTMRTDNVEFV
jgi:hypothetical protein